MPAPQAERLLRPALKGRPLRIVDKTRAKYVLYRAEGSPKLLKWTLHLLPRQPEYVDTFTAFWANYDRSRKIEREIGDQLEEGSPYDYVQGELWHVVARVGSEATLRRLMHSAQKDSRDGSATLALKWGVMAFLMAGERAGLQRATGRIRHLPSLLQALLVPLLPNGAFRLGGIVQNLLTSQAYEPAVVLAEPLARRGLTLESLGLQAHDLTPQAQNVFAGLGLIPRPNHPVDQVGEILGRRYGIVNWAKWQGLFGPEYTHALQILLHADHLYLPGRSEWMSSQNSFNDALVRTLLLQFERFGLMAPVRLVGINGDLVKFGVLVGVGQPLDRTYPAIASPFRAFNNRRNLLPGSHPYATRGGAKNRYLQINERRHYTTLLRRAYNEIIGALDRHL